MSERAEALKLAIDLRLAPEWASFGLEDMEPEVLTVLGDALRFGYSLGYRDARAGLPFPGGRDDQSVEGS